MNDRGEKIVALAYELLQSSPGASIDPTPKKAVSLTMLYLTAVLAGVGGAALTEFTHENLRPLNRYEKTELNALIYYAAHIKGIDEASLRAEIEQKFHLASFDDITQHEFTLTRRYLQEKAQ